MAQAVLKPNYSHEVTSGHYNRIASRYDIFLEFLSRAKADFILRFIPLTQDDQLVDVGGGTAQISLMVHTDVGMKKPVVCVDPSPEMLNIAKKNGAITVQATAEDFFASKPDYPLKVVLMAACAHHFEKPDFVFANVAKYLPEDGVCFVTFSDNQTVPWFKAVCQEFSNVTDTFFEPLCKLIESKGLKCRIVKATKPGEVRKVLWYECIRNKCSTPLLKFSDKELEEGIMELEEQFKDVEVLKFDITMTGIIATKK